MECGRPRWTIWSELVWKRATSRGTPSASAPSPACVVLFQTLSSSRFLCLPGPGFWLSMVPPVLADDFWRALLGHAGHQVASRGGDQALPHLHARLRRNHRCMCALLDHTTSHVPCVRPCAVDARCPVCLLSSRRPLVEIHSLRPVSWPAPALGVVFPGDLGGFHYEPCAWYDGFSSAFSTNPLGMGQLLLAIGIVEVSRRGMLSPGVRGPRVSRTQPLPMFYSFCLKYTRPNARTHFLRPSIDLWVHLFLFGLRVPHALDRSQKCHR